MVKGYKATYNYKCRNQIYEIGQEYKMDKNPIICVQGFHYCEHAIDVLDYYNFLSCFKLLEIEDLSFDTKKDFLSGSKSCSNHIKVTREIVGEELLDLLEFEVIHKSDVTKTFKNYNTKCSYLPSQEISWHFDCDMDTVDTIRGGSCHTDHYYYDKQRNLKFLTRHYGHRFVFTDEGFVTESEFGKHKWQ
jgi:hypothetical protein